MTTKYLIRGGVKTPIRPLLKSSGPAKHQPGKKTTATVTASTNSHGAASYNT